MSSLILKRAPIGPNMEDYNVLNDREVVGRIFLSPAALANRPWMWASGHNGAIERAAHGTGRGGGDCRSACSTHENGLTKLVFTFPNSQRAQQFAGWLFLAGYIDRVVEQNTVMVEVAAGKRTVIIKEAAGRGGRLI
jgi:hypothetical protein